MSERTVPTLSEWRIPLSDLDYGGEEADAVQRVLAGKWLSMGAEVQAFEREFAAMQGTRHGIAVSSATAGLHLALLALGIGSQDEVIQPALNFVAAANVTVAAGATPVFADICGLTEPTIAPTEIEKLISPKTKAVVVMHYGGNLCRMAEIAEICAARGVALIEDACHAVGVPYHDRQGHPLHGAMAGSIGDIAAFSFFSNKNMATGEGGMVVTDRDDLADRVRLLRSHGMTTMTWDRHQGHAGAYDVVANGFNYRLDELRAALGRTQLRKLADNNQRRRTLLLAYHEGVRCLDGWMMPFEEQAQHSSGHLAVVLAPDREKRQSVVAALREQRIQTSLHYPCIADFRAFARWQMQLPKTREFVARAVTLPLFPNLNRAYVDEVLATLGR